MNQRDEFLISRWVDGDLTEEERAHVERLLAESEEARALLREYRQLGGLLKLTRQPPDIDYDALHAAVMRRIEASSVDEGQSGQDADDAETEVAALDGHTHELGQHHALAPPLRLVTAYAGESISERRSLAAGRAGRLRWLEVSRRAKWVAVAASVVLLSGLVWQVSSVWQGGGGGRDGGGWDGGGWDAGGREGAGTILTAESGSSAGRVLVAVGPAGAAGAGSPAGGAGVLVVHGGWERSGKGSAERPEAVAVVVGPPPPMAKEVPLVSLPLWESSEVVGRIELMPGSAVVSGAGGRGDDDPPWLSW